MTFYSETVKEIPMLESSAYDILPEKKESINIVPHFVLKEKIGQMPLTIQLPQVHSFVRAIHIGT